MYWLPINKRIITAYKTHCNSSGEIVYVPDLIGVWAYTDFNIAMVHVRVNLIYPIYPQETAYKPILAWARNTRFCFDTVRLVSRRFDTVGRFCPFYNSDNFCDVLFALLNIKPLLKKMHSLKTQFALKEPILSFKSRPPSRRESKIVLTKLCPLKVYLFPLRLRCLVKL